MLRPCTAPLALVCPKCNFQDAPGFKEASFIAGCGKILDKDLWGRLQRGKAGCGRPFSACGSARIDQSGSQCRSRPFRSTRVLKTRNSSCVGGSVVGTESGTTSSKPVDCLTVSILTPGCSDFNRMRLESSAKSIMHSGVMQYFGPPPGIPIRWRASAPPLPHP